jgi:hypothetical protein
MIDRQEARADVARIDPAADRWLHTANRARATTDPRVGKREFPQAGSGVGQGVDLANQEPKHPVINPVNSEIFRFAVFSSKLSLRK